MTVKRILIIVGSLLGLCVVLTVVGWGALYLSRPRGETGPTVIIKEPSNGAQVNTYDMTLVRGLATDPTGIVGVELWVDGQLEASARSQLEKGSNPFPVLEGWEAEAPGQHTLTVRAYNSDGASKHATVRVEALDVPRPVPTPISHEVQEGDTLQTIATGYGVSTEDIAEQNPGLEEPVEPGDSVVIPFPSPESEDPTPPEERLADTVAEEHLAESEPGELYPEDGPPEPIESIELSPWLAIVARMPFLRIVPAEPMEAALEVEAAFLEVDRTYDGVYCYVSLAGSDTERLPAEGDMESLGERRWGIEAHMGPDSRRMVSILSEEGGLEIRVNCLGYTGTDEGGELSDLGTLMASHFEDEWDGGLIEQSVTGPDGWFRLGYRIWPAGAEPEEGAYPAAWLAPPANLQHTAIFDALGFHYGFVFDYPTGLEDVVDGFIVYRNGAQLPEASRPRYNSGGADQDYTTWFVEVDRSNFYPSCPSRHEFYMVAYNEDDESGYFESDPSNSVFVESDPVPCYESKVARVTFEQLWTYCLSADDCVCSIFSCTHHWNYAGVGCTHECDPNLWAIPWGHVWVNDEKVFTEHRFFESSTKYPISDACETEPPELATICVDQASKELLLGPFDDLTITMKLWDAEFSPLNKPDRMCHGEYTISQHELYTIANQPAGQRWQTYEPEFESGGSNCFLKFTVEILDGGVHLPREDWTYTPVEPFP